MRRRYLQVLTIAALFTMSAAIALHPRWSTAPLPVQLRPFVFLQSLVEPGNTYFDLRNIGGNLALYMVPSAAAMLLLRNVIAVTLLTAAVAAVVEVIQLVIGGRVIDIDDIILAVVGALIAAFAIRAVPAYRRRTDVTSVDDPQ